MITNKKEYYHFLQEDKKANGFSGRVPHLISIWEKDVIWKYLRVLRTSEFLHHIVSMGGWKAGVFYFPYKLYQYRLFRSQMKTGINIPMNVFGPGLAIGHVGPIIINGFAKVGNNCTLQTGVVIGINGTKPEVATIGDNVWIGAGAKIIGKVRIANNVVIGANAVVCKDINEEGSVWGGVPAKRIRQGS